MKCVRNKILENASWIIGCRIMQSALALIVTMLTARYLGPSNYGLINYAASLIAFTTPIVQLGLGNIEVQEFVNYPQDEGKIMGTSILLSIISAVVCFGGVLTFASIANAGETTTILVTALYGILLFFQGAELLQYWFQAKYLSKYASIVSFFAYVMVSAYKVYLLAASKNVFWFAISNAFDYLIIMIGLIVVYYKLGGKKLQFSKSVAARMLDKSKYYILANMMVVIFTQTDRIMLKLMMNDSATGYYSAAATCAALANFVYLAVIDSARPLIFEHHKQSKVKFEKSISTLYAVIIYMSLLMCLVMTICSSVIIRVLYGAEYTEAVNPLRVVVWYTTFSYIGSIRNIWILAEHQQKYLWLINLSGVIANIILNAVMIPFWGIIGASIASLLTQFFSNVVISFMIKATRNNTYLMLKGLDIRLILAYVKNRKLEP